MVRSGLLALIQTEEGIEVVGEPVNGAEAVDPEARILVLTSFSEDEKILTAIQVGARGCLLKVATADELLPCIARGSSNKVIGDKLFISEPTVRTHLSNILTKLELPNRTQAA